MSDSTRDTTAIFTGDDYQLIAESAYREEERRELFKKLYGIESPADDQLDRLRELALRINLYLKMPAPISDGTS